MTQTYPAFLIAGLAGVLLAAAAPGQDVTQTFTNLQWKVIYQGDLGQEAVTYSSGTGYAWGAWCASTLNSASIYPHATHGFRILREAWDNGSYIYGIFDPAGGNDARSTPQDMDLGVVRVTFTTNPGSSATDVRLLIQDAAGRWYLSDNVTTLTSTWSPVTETINLAGFTWQAVDGPAALNLTLLNDETTSAALTVDGTDTAPDLSRIRGGGLYIESATPNGERLAFDVQEMTWDGTDGPVTLPVTVDLTRQRFVGGYSAFEREQVINLHDQVKNNEFTAAEATHLVDDLAIRFGRFIGGLNWVRTQMTAEDLARPGYVDVSQLIAYCQANADGLTNHWPWQKLGWQEWIVGTHPTFFPGQVDAGFNPGSNDAAAEWFATVWEHYWTPSVRPLFFEPINEPFVQTSSLNTDSQGIVDYHEAIIDRLHQDVPSVMVGGPASAWPEFSRWDYGHWVDQMGRYIDQLGAKTDFISWHIYSQVGDDGDLRSHRSGSNTEYMLDLVENYCINQVGSAVPVVISEFGGAFLNGSSWYDSYTPLRDWYVLKSVMGKALTFLERPDLVVKAVPFITGKATWHSGPSSYPWATYRDVGGTWQETHLTKFHAFWKGVAGDRYPVVSGDPDVQAQVYVDGTTVHLCLNNIDPDYGATLDIQALLEAGTAVQSATVTRLYWDGTQPVLEENLPLADWNQVALGPEESVLVRLTLNQAPSASLTLQETLSYGDRTVVPFSGAPERFTVPADLGVGTPIRATLRVGVTRAHGRSRFPIVTFNGQALPYVTDWAGTHQESRTDFSGRLEIPVPVALVQASNQVEISFATASGTISSVALDLAAEAPAGGVVVEDLATADIPVSATVSGSYTDTHESDDSYQALTEVQVGRRSKARSELEHKWMFNVTGCDLVQFWVEAHHTPNGENDDFVFAYSTDNANFTDMFTVTKTADDDTLQTFTLPSSLSGTVYIRVQDTDRGKGRSGLDTLYVDTMFVASEGSGSNPPEPPEPPEPPDPGLSYIDDFESGGFAAGGWTVTGAASVKESAAFAGSFGAELKKTASIEVPVSTAGASAVTLEYARTTAGFDAGEVLTVEWSVDGTTWNLLESTRDTSWSVASWALPAGAADQAGFRVRFTTNANRNNEKASVDNVVISGS